MLVHTEEGERPFGIVVFKKISEGNSRRDFALVLETSTGKLYVFMGEACKLSLFTVVTFQKDAFQVSCRGELVHQGKDIRTVNPELQERLAQEGHLTLQGTILGYDDRERAYRVNFNPPELRVGANILIQCPRRIELLDKGTPVIFSPGHSSRGYHIVPYFFQLDTEKALVSPVGPTIVGEALTHPLVGVDNSKTVHFGFGTAVANQEVISPCFISSYDQERALAAQLTQ